MRGPGSAFRWIRRTLREAGDDPHGPFGPRREVQSLGPDPMSHATWSRRWGVRFLDPDRAGPRLMLFLVVAPLLGILLGALVLGLVYLFTGSFHVG